MAIAKARQSIPKTGQPRTDASRQHPVYPFSALVGQDEMTTALLLLAVDPRIGGVLLMGHRGTGKSTAVRALADVLPPREVMAGCRFHCPADRPSVWCDECRERTSGRDTPQSDSPYVEMAPVPVVELPLGATEDRLVGSLDIEQAMRGVRAFQPGLLAAANGGFLYIDEVNLLDDSLVDLLLDVSASGVNVVEREGISLRHPSRFALVGSGNPEEGDLRPQLLDRFALYVMIGTVTELKKRVEIVKRREKFERDPYAFLAEWQTQQDELRGRIADARKRLENVAITDEVLEQIAALCLALQIDGHRGELSVMRSAAAHAALMGREQVTAEDIQAVAVPALRHRLRRDPLDEVDPGDRVVEALDAILPVSGELHP